MSQTPACHGVRVANPVIAYNNPFDTRVDLVPELLARLYHEGLR